MAFSKSCFLGVFKINSELLQRCKKILTMVYCQGFLALFLKGNQTFQTLAGQFFWYDYDDKGCVSRVKVDHSRRPGVILRFLIFAAIGGAYFVKLFVANVQTGSSVQQEKFSIRVLRIGQTAMVVAIITLMIYRYWEKAFKPEQYVTFLNELVCIERRFPMGKSIFVKIIPAQNAQF